MFVRTAAATRAPLDTAGVRSHNTAILLHHLWEARELSRADLARRSGLARSTVSLIVHALLDQKLIEESHLAPSGGGRPPIVLRFDDDRNVLLGLELAHDKVAALVTNLRGTVLDYRWARQDVHGDPEGSLAKLRMLAEGALQATGRSTRLGGIGLAVPAPVDMTDPDRLAPRILAKWAGYRPGDMLRQAFQVPVYVDNEANLGALAEGWWGAGRQVATFAYLRADAGVGAGFLADGTIYRGAMGIAGEIGHTAIDASGPRCRCGLYGCLEAMIGEVALVRRTRARLVTASDTSLDPDDLGLQQIVRAARQGDWLARDVVTEAGKYLGIATANLLNLMNPGLVVLGGSLAAAGDDLLAPLREIVRERALWTSVDQAEVVLGQVGPQDVALGAATLVLQAALNDPSVLPPL